MGRRAGLLLVLTLLVGCESASFLPPPPPPENDPLAPTVARAKELLLILPAEDAELTRALDQASRQWAGVQKCVFRSERPGSAEAQAEAIRSAAARGVSGLIVIADDPAAVAPAAREALGRGVAVVPLLREIPGLSGKTSAVVLAPLGGPARQVVAAALEDAGKRGFEAGAPALLLIKQPADLLSDLRVAALREAAAEAKLNVREEARFEDRSQGAQKVVLNTLKAEPGLAIVLADEDNGLQGVSMARGGLAPPGKFVSAGFGCFATTNYLVNSDECSAVAELRPIDLGRRAVEAALKLADGQSLPDRQALEPNLLRSKGQGQVPVPKLDTSLIDPSNDIRP